MIKITPFFIEKISEENREAYNRERLQSELYRAKIITLVLVAIEAVMILLSLINYGYSNFEGRQSHYFMLYLIFLSCMLGYYYIFRIIEYKQWYKHKALSILSVSYVTFILLWNISIVLLDQQSQYGITSYIVAMISISFLIGSEFWVTLLSYGIAHTFFIITLPYFQSSVSIVYGHYINSSILLIMSCCAAFFFHQFRIINYNQLVTIRHKNKELELLHHELAKQVQEDGLTGLYNKRKCSELLSEFWQESLTKQQTLSIMLIDVDYFKLYNDNYGHLTGDDCLKTVAEVLDTCTIEYVDGKQARFTARFGGEEFILASIADTKETSMILADNIRDKIEHLNIPHIASPIEHITVSIGVFAEIPMEEMDWDLFVNRADQALYNAKAIGRNRVQWFAENTKSE